MRLINKKTPPRQLTQWLKHRRAGEWETLTRDEHEIYAVCRKQLCDEQNNLSAYTERSLEGVKVHIDHFHKRSDAPALIFDWNNLLLDAITDSYGARHKDSLKQLDYALLINPVMEDPHLSLTYAMNGDMVGLNERGDYTIRAFNLNHSHLRQLRLKIMMDVKSYMDGGLNRQEILNCMSQRGFSSLVEWCIINL